MSRWLWSGWLLRTARALLSSRPLGAMTAAASRTLRDKAEADRCEVMIEREGNPDSDAFHDREARRIDRGKLVQVRAAKIIPRLFQVAQLAREDPHGSRLADGILPRQRYIAVCIAIEEREGFDDDGNWEV